MGIFILDWNDKFLYEFLGIVTPYAVYDAQDGSGAVPSDPQLDVVGLQELQDKQY